VVRELKRSGYQPKMAILVRALFEDWKQIEQDVAHLLHVSHMSDPQ